MSAVEIFGIVAAYLVGLAVALLISNREYKRAPEKARRYAALPWHYRLVFPLIVVPLFTAVPLLLYGRGFGVLAAVTGVVFAPLAMLVLDLATVRWYRRAGLLSVQGEP
jgi:hypothetical protein